jgi:TonB family protein
MLGRATAAWVLLEMSAVAEPAPITSTSAYPNGSPISIGIPHTCGNYPEDAIVAGADGTTVLAFQITSEGRVMDITVARSSGNSSLDQAAVDCASRWLYKPATQNGQAVEVSWKAAVQWILPDQAKVYKALMPVARDRQLCATRPAGTAAVHDETIVFFHILTDGSVSDISVEKSSGSPELDAYGKSCVSHWSYYPAPNAAGPIEVEWYARLTW